MSSIDGSYEISARTPLGVMDQTLILVAGENNSLSGRVIQGETDIPFADGKYDGDQFEFEVLLPTPVGKKNAPCSGSVDGDSISGKLRTPFGVAKFTGKRQS